MGKAGRPKAELDLETVEELAAIQCTDEEIAAVCGVHRSTVTRRKVSDPEFAAAIENGRQRGKMSLRRAQWKTAVDNGNATMQIWLGKQYLDQADKSELLDRRSKKAARQKLEEMVAVMMEDDKKTGREVQ